MKFKVLTRITGTALLAGLTLSAHVIAQEAQENKRESLPHYKVIDLGTLGGTFSQAYGMNTRGQVGGGATLANGNLHAFLWTKHIGLQDLGTLGGPNSAADGPDEKDEVPITSELSKIDPFGENFCLFNTNHLCIGAIWKGGILTALPTLGGNNAQTYGLNNHGQVVGFSENERKEKKGDCATTSQLFDFEAVIWEPNGEIRELPPLPGDTVGFGFGINDHGQVVGASGLCSNTSVPPSPAAPHAVLWEKDGSPTDLGNLGSTINNVASSINNRGEVVGGAPSSLDGTIHAFLWTKDTGMQDLGAFPGAVVTVAPCCNTINDKGEVVGFSIDGKTGNSRALLWQNKVPIDLNTLIPKNSPWYLQQALSLNDAGQIVGYGLIHGETHAFLATPCDRNYADAE